MFTTTRVRPYTLAKYGGKTVFHFGGPMTFKATADQTGGAFGMVEYVAPVGAGTPPHIHTNEDEAFYILDGELTVYSEGIEETVGAGGFVFLPRNVRHHWVNHGPHAVRFLVLFTPGGFEGALEQYAEIEAGVGELDEVDHEAGVHVLRSYGLQTV